MTPPPPGTGPTRPHGVTAVSLLTITAVAAAPGVWWILDRILPSGVDIDAGVEPPAVDPDVAPAIGITSSAIVLVVAVLVSQRLATRAWPAWFGVVLGCAVAAGSYAGLFAHVVTRPTIGANIGAGLLLLGAAPVAVALLLVGLHAWRRSVTAG